MSADPVIQKYVAEDWKVTGETTVSSSEFAGWFPPKDVVLAIRESTASQGNQPIAKTKIISTNPLFGKKAEVENAEYRRTGTDQLTATIETGSLKIVEIVSGSEPDSQGNFRRMTHQMEFFVDNVKRGDGTWSCIR